MKLPQQYKITIEIESIAYGGNGVGRHDGIVYFVPGVLLGETVLVKPVLKKKTYVVAHPEKILKPSPNRIIPKCPYALQVPSSLQTYCPGCQYQHMEYSEELKAKNEQFGDLIERIAKLDPNIRKAPIASPQCYGYRNKITLHSQGQNNKNKYGYYAIDNTSLIEIRNCSIACRQINTLLDSINADEPSETREPSTLTLRYTENDGAKHWFKFARNNSATDNTLETKKRLLQENTSYGLFNVPRDSFFQINYYLRDMLIKETLNILKQNPTEYVFDLFCGVGIFGICAAKTNTSRVYASDIDANAINTAKTNAALHRTNNIKFFALPAIKAANKIFKEIPPKKTTLILDPPRTGLNKKLIQDIITKYKPKNIVYISCAADTLCRDLKIFSEANYLVHHTRLFDMFPRTAHFETVTFLSCLNL